MTILRPERAWFSCLCLTMVSGANSSSLILPLPDHGVRRQLQLPDLASPPPLAEAGTVLLAVVPLLAPFPWFRHPGDLSGRCPCSSCPSSVQLTSVSESASKSSSLGSGGPDFHNKCNAPVVANIQIRVVISSTWNLKGALFGQTFVI